MCQFLIISLFIYVLEVLEDCGETKVLLGIAIGYVMMVRFVIPGLLLLGIDKCQSMPIKYLYSKISPTLPQE